MKRLLDEPLSGDAARILRSADADAPVEPDAAQARILAAYAVARPALAMPLAAPSPRRRGGWAIAAGTLVLAGALIAGWRLRSPHAHVSVAAPSGLVAIAGSGAPQPARAEPTPPTMRVEDLPLAPVPPPPLAARPSPATVPVLDELALVDAARAALRDGHARETLAHVASCRSRFLRPQYAEEADALEVQALAALGRDTEARAKANVFFLAHPDSPYENRIRTATGAVAR